MLPPSFFVSRTSRSRARLSSLASVGNITAFGCTVVSITTRARSDGFIASVRVATARLSCNSALSLSSPIRWRQRVSDERSNTNACSKNPRPTEVWKEGVPPQGTDKAPLERSEGVLGVPCPRHQPRRQWRLARLVGVARPKRLLQKTPIDRPRQLRQRVFHIDDLVKP